ncbi:hypothetical protein DESUT3_07030 [Desulfuromonas versatilis]|uniref:Uncharacterized protein n=1 Tax=Desulfuromonas versatilis TaxID=2802975 RepID=A0ABN6DWM6_9BACT|nr:hypothetical protein [Desulfuromonas versatilis]BCR03634.1 hypothetical protein DESUT3_07030 [Desulfuromonas versatilis]
MASYPNQQQTLSGGFGRWLGALLVLCLLVNPLGITAPKRFWLPGDLNLVRPVATLATAATALQKTSFEQRLPCDPESLPPILALCVPAAPRQVTFLPRALEAELPDSLFLAEPCAPRPPPVRFS